MGTAVTYSNTFFYVYWIADRRATARTTTLSRRMQPQKNVQLPESHPITLQTSSDLNDLLAVKAKRKQVEPQNLSNALSCFLRDRKRCDSLSLTKWFGC